MQLFYEPGLKANDTEGLLNPEESQHAVRVLRKKTGDEITIINGKGGIFKAVITKADHRQLGFYIAEYKPVPKPLPYIHIALALLKKPERTEWFIEKAIEIGVSEISIFTSKHTEKKNLKTERLTKIAVSALKQSGNLWLPELNCSKNFEELINKPFSGRKYIAYCRTEKTKHLKNTYTAAESAMILIGPEGDFSNDEVESSLQKGFEEVSLGESRLRAETAALYALMTFSLGNV